MGPHNTVSFLRIVSRHRQYPHLRRHLLDQIMGRRSLCGRGPSFNDVALPLRPMPPSAFSIIRPESCAMSTTEYADDNIRTR